MFFIILQELIVVKHIRIFCKIALLFRYVGMTSTTIRIRKGLDIRLFGEARHKTIEINPRTFASKPIDFPDVFPRLTVQEGDRVLAGSPLYNDKNREQVLFTSPVSGTVKEIRRGEERPILQGIVESGGEDQRVDFGKADPALLSREEIVAKLLESGIWPVLRQRPFNIIANPSVTPKAIFIPAFDTAPLAPDLNYLVEGEVEAFQAGVTALAKLTSGKVHLNVTAQPEPSPVFFHARGVQLNRFSGPHPAGNVSAQVARLDPVNKGEAIWYLRPQEVLTIGRFFLTGTYDASRTFALTGPMVKEPAYYKTLSGACIHDMVDRNILPGNPRFISGNVLTGARIDANGYAGFYDSQITVIPEGNHSEFLGWAMPGWNKFSFYRQFFSFLFPQKKYSLDTNLHGGHRSFVITGKYEKVFPFDIYPMQLLKAILAEDIDLMENLGIYEIDAEDFALIEFIDTSKTEIQALVRQGLDLVRKETT